MHNLQVLNLRNLHNLKNQRNSFFRWDEGYDAGDAVRNIAEAGLAVPTGVVDFGTDLLNMIPGVDIPEIT